MVFIVLGITEYGKWINHIFGPYTSHFLTVAFLLFFM